MGKQAALTYFFQVENEEYMIGKIKKADVKTVKTFSPYKTPKQNT